MYGVCPQQQDCHHPSGPSSGACGTLLAFKSPQWLFQSQMEVWLGVGKQLNRVVLAAACWELFRTSLGVLHPMHISIELW